MFSSRLPLALFLFLALLQGCGKNSLYTLEDYSRVEKVDIHVHLYTEGPGFVELSREDRFRFLNIAVHSDDEEEMHHRHHTGYLQGEAHPDRVAIGVSFPMAAWDEPGWVEDTIGYLDQSFDRGAVAVKVWKNIGMEFRDQDGDLVMVDDPQLDPVFDHMAAKEIRMIGHLGEPLNCWLPLEEMTVNNDRGYFSRNPQYHMHLHPEMPTHEEQMEARNRMLEKHRDLIFIGAHFASLEWSVDALGEFLDRFPNAVVDTAARMGQLEYQSNADWEKVRSFIIKYQDRILYGTDLTMSPDDDPERFLVRARERWQSDWKYLTTDATQSVSSLDEPVKGLALPKSVVDKLYRLNAKRLFPESWDGR